MREIKFRCLDIAEQKMLYAGDACIRVGMDGTVFEKEFQGVWGANECLIVMQFTGLKDKNGKEIYEGDIVKMEEFWYGDTHIINVIGQVVFKDGEFFITSEKIEYYNLFDVTKNYRGKIIGNIYENPELLEVKP